MKAKDWCLAKACNVGWYFPTGHSNLEWGCKCWDLQDNGTPCKWYFQWERNMPRNGSVCESTFHSFFSYIHFFEPNDLSGSTHILSVPQNMEGIKKGHCWWGILLYQPRCPLFLGDWETWVHNRENHPNGLCFGTYWENLSWWFASNIAKCRAVEAIFVKPFGAWERVQLTDLKGLWPHKDRAMLQGSSLLRGCIWSTPQLCFLEGKGVLTYLGWPRCLGSPWAKINWCAKVPDMICVLEWVPFSHFRLGFVLKVCQFSSLHQSFKKDSHPECLVMSRERCCPWELSGRWWPVYWPLEVCPSVGVNFLPINL